MVITIVKVTFYVGAAVCVLASVMFFGRALAARRSYQKGLFGVLRQAERQNMLVRAFSGVGLLVLAFVFVGLGWLVGWWGSTAAMAETADPTPTPLTTVVETPAVVVVTATFTPEPAVSATPAVIATATLAPPPPLLPTGDGSVVATVTATATTTIITTTQPTVAPSPTAGLPVAVVNSPVVGLYLRTGPGGEIIERLEDQVAVGLLGEEQTVEGLLWVKVKSPTGSEGWVAADYLNFNP